MIRNILLKTQQTYSLQHKIAKNIWGFSNPFKKNEEDLLTTHLKLPEYEGQSTVRITKVKSKKGETIKAHDNIFEVDYHHKTNKFSKKKEQNAEKIELTANHPCKILKLNVYPGEIYPVGFNAIQVSINKKYLQPHEISDVQKTDGLFLKIQNKDVQQNDSSSSSDASYAAGGIGSGYLFGSSQNNDIYESNNSQETTDYIDTDTGSYDSGDTGGGDD